MLNDNGRIINISTGTTRFCNPGNISKFDFLINNAGIGATIPFEKVTEERRNMMIAQTALGRLGKPEDIGGIVAFLCSEAAGWITGQRIEASGGIAL